MTAQIFASVCDTYNGKDVIYPPIRHAIGNEAEEKWGNRNTKGDHDGPDSHESSSLLLKSGLGHDSTTNSRRGADKKGSQCTAGSHGAISRTVGASDIADQRGNEREEKNRAAAISIRDRSPQ